MPSSPPSHPIGPIRPIRPIPLSLLSPLHAFSAVNLPKTTTAVRKIASLFPFPLAFQKIPRSNTHSRRAHSLRRHNRRAFQSALVLQEVDLKGLTTPEAPRRKDESAEWLRDARDNASEPSPIAVAPEPRAKSVVDEAIRHRPRACR